MQRIRTRVLERDSTSMARYEGNRGSENGKQDLPHVSGRTSVQLTKECAEQQGNAANRKKRERLRREGGERGKIDGMATVSWSLHIHLSRESIVMTVQKCSQCRRLLRQFPTHCG